VALLNRYLDKLKTDENVHVDRIYLVGDIIDLWQLKKKFYWTNEYNIFIRKMIGYAKNGTKVVWLIGNHEDQLDKLIGYEFGNILISDECIFMANDVPLLVTHGHIGDKLIDYNWWLVRLGDYLYGHILNLDTFIKRTKKWFGIDIYVARTIKRNVKAAMQFVLNFQNFMIDYAQRKGCNGVIFGHIHTPQISKLILNEKMFYYINIGDVVENCNIVLFDHDESRFDLIRLIDHGDLKTHSVVHSMHIGENFNV
jgi:UDP-2,3-diacylglucosamine pyrophosphatase LpxH